MSKEDLVAIRAIFAAWQNDPDGDVMFSKLFDKIDSYAGAVFSIKKPKLFVKCYRDKDYETKKNDNSGQLIYDGRDMAFEVIYYKNDTKMMTDVRACLSNLSDIPEELYSLKYKHIIFIVPGTQLVMDIAVEKNLSFYDE